MSSKIFAVAATFVILSGATLSCSSDADGPEVLATGGYLGAGAIPGAGGLVATGGLPGTGGAVNTGGVVTGTGGTLATGGVLGSGGMPGSGGVLGSGGMPGSGGVLGSGGAASGGAQGSGGSAAHADLGKGDGKDVIAIGDSWMSLGFDGIQVALKKASGQPYRTYGVAGTQLLNGQIPGQYTSAKRADPKIKTVVMTGGGNDVLLTGLSTDCANGGERCKAQLQKIADALGVLWAQMSADGVMDVVHVMYSSDAGQGVKIDPAVGLKKICDAVPPPMRCHLLATDPFVMGSLAADGIHPSAASFERIGKGVYDLMVAEGMRR